MKVSMFGPNQQAVGEFDGGKITEQKPIGFPGEGSAVKRLGPLFYWAWMHSPVEGYIPPHPHNGFEIMTYMLSGKASHGDSLGTRSVVEAGGIQLMLTGSGVYHEERIIGPDAEGFQIWFEPHLAQAFKQEPSYHQFEHEEFPKQKQDGLLIKTVIGGDSPVKIKTDAKMWDIQFEPGSAYTHVLPEGYYLGILAFRGDGFCGDDHFQERDFVVVENRDNKEAVVTLQANQDRKLHLIIIQTPISVDYPLYPNR